MNERQAIRVVKNVVRLESLAADIAAPVQRELTRVLAQVAAMVEAMELDPLNTTLFRQAHWRTTLVQLQAMLGPANDRFYNDLVEGLAAEIPNQIKDAERFMLDAGITPYQTAAEVLSPGVTVGPTPTTVGPPSLDAGLPQITRTQLYRAAADTKVLGKSLDELFESTTARPPFNASGFQSFEYGRTPNLDKGSVFIRSQINAIDATVKRGFLLSEANSEISKRLLTEGAARARREAQTLARTAVMQMSADAHGAFWDANSSVIAGWEYDALLDYRTCPICAPWDGRTAAKRSDLPSPPLHPNCRCSVLPLTETEAELRKERGPQRRTVVELEPYEGPDSKPAETDTQRVYARPVTVDGKRYWRVARDIKQDDHPLTMGEFLAQTSDDNLEKAMLSKARAKRFREEVASGKSPDEALVRVTQRLRNPEVAGISARKRTRGLPKLEKSASPRRPPQLRSIPRRRRPAA